MQGKDYSLPMWVETDLSKFVSGRLHYCNEALLPSPPISPLAEWCRSVITPELLRVDTDDMLKSISISLGVSGICHTFDAWAEYLKSTHTHPAKAKWPNCIDEEPFNPMDRELTIEFTGMPVSEGIREFAKQYLQEFKIEEKLTCGDPTAVTSKY